MKITLPVALLISSTQAKCDFQLDPSSWQFSSGSADDLQVTTGSDGIKKISNVTGNTAQFYLPVKSADSGLTQLSCEFPQLHMVNQNSQVGFANFGSDDDVNNNRAQAILIPHNKIRYYSVHTYSENQGGNYSTANNKLQETGNAYFNNISASLNESSGTATVDQNGSNLVNFQSDEYTSGYNFLVLRLHDVGSFAEIKDLSKEELLQKELTAKTAKLAAKTAKLDQCQSDLEKIHALSGDDTSGKGPSSIVDLAETDFSVQNSDLNNDFSAKDKALNTSLIVNYIQFGLIAALTSVVAYQYKGIQTLKRVANGSDYQKM